MLVSPVHARRAAGLVAGCWSLVAVLVFLVLAHGWLIYKFEVAE